MSYTPPAGSAANFSWVGVAPYAAPTGDSVDFAWAPAGVIAVGSGALSFLGAGTAVHGAAGAASGMLGFSGGALAEHLSLAVEGGGAGALDFTGQGAAAHGTAGAAIGSLTFSGASSVAHGVAASGAGFLAFVGTCAAVHPRYEVRGEVRLGGVLVNRLVRCYKRTSGHLVGEADTVGGRYAVPAGFDDAEVYVLAIDLSAEAADWIPPAANRLVPVLAEDAA